MRMMITDFVGNVKRQKHRFRGISFSVVASKMKNGLLSYPRRESNSPEFDSVDIGRAQTTNLGQLNGSGINFEVQLCESKKNLTKRQKCGIILSVYILGKLKSVR